MSVCAHISFIEGIKTALQNSGSYSIIKRAALTAEIVPSVTKGKKVMKMQKPPAPSVDVTTPMVNPYTRKKI